jgi:hypothetical protein
MQLETENVAENPFGADGEFNRKDAVPRAEVLSIRHTSATNEYALFGEEPRERRTYG